MRKSISSGLALLSGTLAVAASSLTARGQADDFLLIDQDLTSRQVRVTEINSHALSYVDRAGTAHTAAISDCIALIRREGGPRAKASRRLLLSDGQRLPGTVASAASPGGDRFAWVHPWLGRIDVPLDDIRAVVLQPGRPAPEPAGEDVILLVNGDRLEGIITGAGDAITIEIGAGQTAQPIEVPLDRIAAAAMITPRKPAAGRRVFFRDGTVLGVRRFDLGADGYVRLTTALTPAGEQPMQVMFSEITAIIFEPEKVIPLGRLAPASIESSAPRYVLPRPRTVGEDAPLGPAEIEYRGPLVVRYRLPDGCRRFAAEAILPPSARAWGDFLLIVAAGDEELYRARLNGEHPTDTINVPIAGRELTVELTQGANGPIQDRLILRRPLLLVE
jgi:hypothetical protein